jgi:hypothetical protein
MASLRWRLASGRCSGQRPQACNCVPLTWPLLEDGWSCHWTCAVGLVGAGCDRSGGLGSGGAAGGAKSSSDWTSVRCPELVSAPFVVVGAVNLQGTQARRRATSSEALVAGESERECCQVLLVVWVAVRVDLRHLRMRGQARTGLTICARLLLALDRLRPGVVGGSCGPDGPAARRGGRSWATPVRARGVRPYGRARERVEPLGRSGGCQCAGTSRLEAGRLPLHGDETYVSVVRARCGARRGSSPSRQAVHSLPSAPLTTARRRNVVKLDRGPRRRRPAPASEHFAGACLHDMDRMFLARITPMAPSRGGPLNHAA